MWIAGLILLLCVICFGIPLILWSGIRKKGRALADEVRKDLGGTAVLLSGCGVIEGYNRVPGVLALSPIHLVHRSVIMGYRGETPLSAVRGYTLKDTRETEHARARKYRRAVVLTVDAPGRPLPLFVLAAAEAEAWRGALENALAALKK